MPDRGFLHWAFLGVMGAHVVQAMAICWLLVSKLKIVDSGHAPGWFLGALSLGPPLWFLALALKRANTQGRLKRL